MITQIEVPEYAPERGLTLLWEDDAVIEVMRTGETLAIRANRGGLLSLARHLLTLAQDGVPAGTHFHMDELAPLEPGSMSVVVEKLSG